MLNFITHATGDDHINDARFDEFDEAINKLIFGRKRTDLFERRVRLMKQWGDFLAKPRPVAPTVDLQAERQRREAA
jgi:hypothetical protein